MPKPWQGTRPTTRSDTRLLSPTIKCALSLCCSCRELRNLASEGADQAIDLVRRTRWPTPDVNALAVTLPFLEPQTRETMGRHGA
jgi:hypothetical protein